jgi:hypothetical protein
MTRLVQSDSTGVIQCEKQPAADDAPLRLNRFADVFIELPWEMIGFAHQLNSGEAERRPFAMVTSSSRAGIWSTVIVTLFRSKKLSPPDSVHAP